MGTAHQQCSTQNSMLPAAVHDAHLCRPAARLCDFTPLEVRPLLLDDCVDSLLRMHTAVVAGRPAPTHAAMQPAPWTSQKPDVFNKCCPASCTTSTQEQVHTCCRCACRALASFSLRLLAVRRLRDWEAPSPVSATADVVSPSCSCSKKKFCMHVAKGCACRPAFGSTRASRTVAGSGIVRGIVYSQPPLFGVTWAEAGTGGGVGCGGTAGCRPRSCCGAPRCAQGGDASRCAAARGDCCRCCASAACCCCWRS